MFKDFSFGIVLIIVKCACFFVARCKHRAVVFGFRGGRLRVSLEGILGLIVLKP
jgi:hypothetical protein